jgi:predicted enzyme related to lactoylglutathione lyase
MADKYYSDGLLAMAAEALDTTDSAKVDELYTAIVTEVHKAFNNNQRDAAAELQRLAKIIETSRTVDESLTFKQRTCEVMLKMSMAERHKGKPLPATTPSSPPPAQLPFKSLDYLYVGTDDFDRDVKHYRDVLKAELIWAFEKFGAKVAALRLAYGPLLLLADHKKAPSVEPIFSVDNLEKTIKELKERGLQQLEGPVETPNGPAYTFRDQSGNGFSILQNDRPEALEKSYKDADNKNALRFT